MATPTDTPPRRTGTTSSIPPKGPTATPSGSNATRREAVKELLAIPLIPLGMLATIDTVRAGEPEAVSPYAMDMRTVQMYEEPIAEAVANLADAYPVLGAVLDRIGTTAPFIALIGLGMSLGMQLAENHGALPEGMRAAGASAGLVYREDMARHLRDEARERTERMNGNGSPSH